jgi:hypothetical protein
LPLWFQGLAMPFEFGFPFPEALQEKDKCRLDWT